MTAAGDVSMDTAGFDSWLRELGWPDSELTRRLRCSRSLPGKWRERGIPVSVYEWVRVRAEAGAAFPPPPWTAWKNTSRKSETAPGHAVVTGS